DEEYLAKMEERVKSKKEKAANILFTLNRLVLVERHKSPIYESLADRVERLVELWREKTKDYERIYTQGVEIVGEINVLSERQRSLGLSDLQYSMLLTLEGRLGKGDGLIKEVKGLLEGLKRHMFPGWIHQPALRKEVERGVRRFSRGVKNRYGLSLEEMNDLYERLIDKVRNYGA
ncbi:MAG: hypothetical protein JRJ70_15490, partial [Deltaproteobacteria bacterium]|nr:hypothetical protein [Deltaproteobacteria bacterium]